MFFMKKVNCQLWKPASGCKQWGRSIWEHTLCSVTVNSNTAVYSSLAGKRSSKNQTLLWVQAKKETKVGAQVCNFQPGVMSATLQRGAHFCGKVWKHHLRGVITRCFPWAKPKSKYLCSSKYQACVWNEEGFTSLSSFFLAVQKQNKSLF